MAKRTSRIGAVFYALWGVIHVVGGAVLLQAALTSPDAFVQAQAGGSALNSVTFSGDSLTIAVARSVFAFHAFNLTWLGLVVTAVAVRLNWRNSAVGYWLNLALVGFTDLGLVLFIVGPGGVMTWADAWIGPALFVPAWLFATTARRSTPGLDASPDSLRPASA